MEAYVQVKPHPYRDEKQKKDQRLTKQLQELTSYHYRHCDAYQRILDGMHYAREEITHYRDLPFLPVTLFKKHVLKSIEKDADYKIVTSSGTGGSPSQIVLDGETRGLQQQVLISIGMDFLGEKRLPMLVIDCPATVNRRDHFSARTAAIQGFSVFGSNRTFALRDDLSLDLSVVKTFLEKYGDQTFLIFGFTWLVWQKLVEGLKANELDLHQGILIHGGGWKKMQEQAVSKEVFCHGLKQTCGITRVHDYYGMAEQAGSIFMECECGHLHCSDYSGVIVRDPKDFSVCENGETGLLQVLSVIPKSYPGHSLLTEDLGRILGEDDCRCGRKGVYFEVLGRAPQAELRGCSDTMQREKDTSSEKNIQWMLGDEKIWQDLHTTGGKICFAPETIEFLDCISKHLRSEKAARSFSDLQYFAFWCRKNHLRQIAEAYEPHRQGVSVSFHVAAGNIPMVFAFSMVAGLLAGTSVVVKLSGKETPQEKLVIHALQYAMHEYPEFQGRIILCRYEHDDEITAKFSNQCEVRILWGTVESVERIQAIPLERRIRDVVFATKYAGSILNADAVMETEYFDQLCYAFYEDTYLNDQNACSSPRVIFWQGKEHTITQARKRFWDGIRQIIKEEQYQIPAALAVRKLQQGMVFAMKYSGEIAEQNNALMRVQVPEFEPEMWKETMPGGFFVEVCGENPEQAKFLFGRDSQTITAYGVSSAESEKLQKQYGDEKGPRIVDVGMALEFSLIWDGYDLIQEMTLQDCRRN